MAESTPFKVLLVSPKSYDDRDCDSTPESQFLLPYSFLPYSVVYLVNYLKKMNLCQADYLDLVVESQDDLFRRVSEETFDLVGFTSTSEARFSTIALIRRVKALSPGTRIVVGGYFFSSTSARVLDEVPEIDFVVRGEGEETLAQLVSLLRSGQGSLNEVAGLCYRKGGLCKRNPPRKAAVDLTPFEIHYPLVQKPGYSLLVPMRNWENDPEKLAFPAMLGRGCNNKCIFCIHRHFPYRRARIDTALRQISWARETLGAKYFMFTDPSFSEEPSFVDEFCRQLLETGWGIEWYCEGRVDIPVARLEKMREAGCISMDFALESGSLRVLKALRKDTDPGMVLQFARACRDLGIRATYFTMASLPEERTEDLEATLDLIQEMSRLGVFTGPAPLIIYPGTRLETVAREKGILPKDFDWFDESFRCTYRFINPRENRMPHYLEHLTPEEVAMFLRTAGRIQTLGHLLSDRIPNPPSFREFTAQALVDGHRKVIIAGAGSGARGVLALAGCLGIEVAALTDRNLSLHGSRVGSVPVVPLEQGLRLGLPILLGTLTFADEVIGEIRQCSKDLGLPDPILYAPSSPRPGRA